MSQGKRQHQDHSRKRCSTTAEKKERALFAMFSSKYNSKYYKKQMILRPLWLGQGNAKWPLKEIWNLYRFINKTSVRNHIYWASIQGTNKLFKKIWQENVSWCKHNDNIVNPYSNMLLPIFLIILSVLKFSHISHKILNNLKGK